MRTRMCNHQNKVAIVTGGTKGIGRAIAKASLTEGAKVVVCSRSADEVKRCVSELGEKASGRISGTACDVGRYEDVEKLTQLAVERFDGIDILINNAGVGIFASVADISPEQWRQVLDTNLTGVYHCCHVA